ncbi:MAG: LytTR family DNA-binding domain-containing protein [Brevundimonas sp.]
MRARLRSVPTAAWVWGFTAYAWVVTTVCAAWFVRADTGVDLITSLVWQGAIYGLWLPVAGIVALILRRFGAGAQAFGATTGAMLALVPLAALGTTWIDLSFRGADMAGWAERALWRLPVAILLYTAIVAVGFAAAHRQRAVEARQRAEGLERDLTAALEAARAAARTDTAQRLMVMAGTRKVPVDLADVEWFAAAGNYVVVHWAEREGLMRETMRALEARLDPAVFARSHRSTLVNLARVTAAQSLSDGSWKLTLTSGADLVVSRTYRDDLLARLGR